MTKTGLFAKLRDTRVSRVRKLGVTAVAVLAGSFLVCGFVGVRFNSSPSLPVGMYITTADEHSNLVEFCPAEPFASLSIADRASFARDRRSGDHHVRLRHGLFQLLLLRHPLI